MANRKRLERYAAKVIKRMQSHPDVISIEIVGSMRRGKAEPGDVDLLVVSERPEMISLKSKADKHKLGPYGYADTFVVTPEVYGAALVRTCSPRPYNWYLMALAKKQGLRLAVTGLAKRSVVIPTPTEESLFDALGIDFVPLKDRGPEELREAGAGTQFTKLLAEIGIRIEGCGGCSSVSSHMNRIGPSECRDQIFEIAKKIEENAKTKRNVDELNWLDRIGIRQLLSIAIERSEEKPDSYAAKAIIAAAKKLQPHRR